MVGRIIPARAGFTSVPQRRGHDEPDHPRSRGVYASTMSPTVPPSGSSPLARGLPTCRSPMANHVGIIPARAGFTGGRACGWRRGADHPRSRGVYIHSGQRIDLDKGSSPLARGLLMMVAGV